MANQIIHFPSIETTRTVFPKIARKAQFTHIDPQTKEVQYNTTAVLPIITFRGTVKLHGSNASIVQTINSDTATGNAIHFQSRKRVLNAKEDLMGLYVTMTKKEHMNAVKSIFKYIRTIMYAEDKKPESIAIFGEWCGIGIQKTVAIASLPKMFVIFAVRVTYLPKGMTAGVPKEAWMDICEHSEKMKEPTVRIFNIYQFNIFSVFVDFNDQNSVKDATQKIDALTLEVEDVCPVGKYFGVEGTGEGIVWQPDFSKSLTSQRMAASSETTYWFKSKGIKHTQNAKLKPEEKVLDPVKKAKIDSFMDLVVTDGRLEQGYHFINREKLLPLEMKSYPAFLAWLNEDVIKEESDRIAKEEIGQKELKAAIAVVARNWFIERLKED